jgi:transposase-like protein
MSIRRKCSLEFKQGATERVREPEVSSAQVTLELGTGTQL